MQRALLLNATFEPLAIIPWQRAITLHVIGKVEVLTTHDAFVHSVSRAWEVPSVVRLMRYVKQRFQPIRFSRANVYLRDNHSCLYCGEKFMARELTWDHVVPRAAGGQTDWTNIVTACVPCNARKGDRTPEQAGMTLLRKPFKPSVPHALRLILGFRDTPEEWKAYLFLS